MGISSAAYHAIKHDIPRAGINIIQNMTGVRDDEPHALSSPHGAILLQQLIYEFADQGDIL